MVKSAYLVAALALSLPGGAALAQYSGHDSGGSNSGGNAGGIGGNGSGSGLGTLNGYSGPLVGNGSSDDSNTNTPTYDGGAGSSYSGNHSPQTSGGQTGGGQTEDGVTEGD